MINFFRVFFSILLISGLLSCKSVASLQKREAKDDTGAANWKIDVRLLIISGNVTTVMNKIGSIAPMLDIQVTENIGDVMPSVTLVSVKLHAVTNDRIQTIRRQLETCPGVLSINIDRF